MYKGRKVIAIAPCYNEELKIGKVVERLKAMPLHDGKPVIDEILVVDDGSTDTSATVARGLGATVISLGYVAGVGAALRTGFKHALFENFELIVVLAGNNKDEPREIPDLLEPLVQGACDFVQGSRFLKPGNRGAMPLYRRVATRVHPILFSACTGKWVTESTNGFRAFRAAILADPRINLDQAWLDGYELEPYLYYKTVMLGYRTAEVGCTKIYPPKKIGYTKMAPITGWWSILRPLLLLRLGLRD